MEADDCFLWVAHFLSVSCAPQLRQKPTSRRLFPDRYEPMGWRYPDWSHVNGPAVNLLKGGILTADRVMTVSQVFAVC